MGKGKWISNFEWQSDKNSQTSDRIIIFKWEVTSNLNDGTGVIKWKLYCGGSTTLYYLVNNGTGTNYLNINGQRVVTIPTSETRNGHTSYNGYVNPGNYLDGRDYYDTNGNYTGVRRWVYGIGTLGSGQFTFDYDQNGNYSFQVNGHFGWYSSNFGTDISKTISVPQVNLHSKVSRTTNSGSNWDNTRTVWKTTNYGATWTQCDVYKTTNGGSLWTKVN